MLVTLVWEPLIHKYSTQAQRNPGLPKPRLFTAGRLDVGTSGLLLVTNDGACCKVEGMMEFIRDVPCVHCEAIGCNMMLLTLCRRICLQGVTPLIWTNKRVSLRTMFYSM